MNTKKIYIDNNKTSEKPEGRQVVNFRQFKTVDDLLRDLQQNIKNNLGNYQAYSFYKKELSYICGWDASQENYNQKLYDKILGRIIRLLRI